MEEVLFLAHRMPYPPDKGDKIRSFHLLRHLSQSYRVHLGAFVDNPEDWRHAPKLGEYCASTCLLPLNPRAARLRSVKGLFSGEALTLPFYRDTRMQDWVASAVREHPLAAIMVFSSAMAQYVADLEAPRRILDFVDVDSAKWLQYARSRRWPASWLYRREGKRLLAHDRAMAQRFNLSLFVSSAEAAVFARMAPESERRLGVLKNGVDSRFFHDSGEFSNPYPADAKCMVFTGAMDYWPNSDGVRWFATEIFPAIQAACPNAYFCIVGARPDKRVQALAQRSGIAVTGRVDDVRPYLAHAHLALAPIRVARGVQNKVLEALAMEKPLLATSQAMEGIDPIPGLDLAIADTPEDWIRLGIEFMSDTSWERHSVANRSFVLEYYDWTRNLTAIDRFLCR